MTWRRPDPGNAGGAAGADGAAAPGGDRGGDARLQQSLVQHRQDIYLALASRLIDAGRLPEAQQVTALLKRDELFELLRSEAGPATGTGQAPLTGAEARVAQQAPAEPGSSLSALVAELRALRATGPADSLSEEMKARARSLREQLATARKAFEDHLALLVRELGKPRAADDDPQVAASSLTSTTQQMNALALLPAGAVLLHFVPLDDSLRIILTTAKVQRAYTVPVARSALSQAVQQLRQGIAQRADVQPVARQLHAWLLAPAAGRAGRRGARTLMLAPAGSLRYLPFAALHDGQQWLVQRYA